MDANNVARVTCPACACLCRDVDLEFDDRGDIVHTYNACRKGAAFFMGSYRENRALPKIEGKPVSIDDAVKSTVEILSNAKNPVIFGLDTSSLETQVLGVGLARKLNAAIDDTSSLCQGLVLERIIPGSMKTCTLDDVRDYSDVMVYWGSDPANSHPRHMSKFSYFPRGKKRQKGWETDRMPICIDVRKSNTAGVCKKFYKIEPKGDEGLINDLLLSLDGKIGGKEIGGKGIDGKEFAKLTNILKKAEHCTIFSGLGLVYSLKNSIKLFDALIEKLNEYAPTHVIPMVGHYNMRGMTQTLYDASGYINKVRFSDGEVDHGSQYSITSTLQGKEADAALIIGADPVSSIPLKTSISLAGIPTITIDAHETPTTMISRVVIPAAITGIEAGGEALRMDGVKHELSAPRENKEVLSDAELLKRILEGV